MNESQRRTCTLPPRCSASTLVDALYEAAELEHNLMCTYLYAAFSLKDGEAEGLAPEEAAAVKRWRQVLLVGRDRGDGTPRGGVEHHLRRSAPARASGAPTFRSIPGYLPASVVVKLAPFNAETLQHFVFLERPHGSDEADGAGFAYERAYVRGGGGARLTPMASRLRHGGHFLCVHSARACARWSSATARPHAFGGDPGLQLSRDGGRTCRGAAGHLPEDRARGVRCDRRAGRGRAAGLGAARTTRSSSASAPSCRALIAKNPGFRPRLPRGHQPGAAAPAAARGARVAREPGRGRDRGPRPTPLTD